MSGATRAGHEKMRGEDGRADAVTKLLVSVRSPEEAEAAWCGGADVIDIKEPARGSLGAATADTVRTIRAALGPRLAQRPVTLSLALDELMAWDAARQAALGRALAPIDRSSVSRVSREEGVPIAVPIALVKIGLAAAAAHQDWPRRLAAWAESLPAGVVPVVAAYADWGAADAPDPWQILAACPAACGGLLLDTTTKDGRHLFDFLTPQRVAGWMAAVAATGRWVALAGSLRGPSLDTACALRPAFVAVRGAVCDGSRLTAVVPQRVAAVVAAVRRQATRPAMHDAEPGRAR